MISILRSAFVLFVNNGDLMKKIAVMTICSLSGFTSIARADGYTERHSAAYNRDTTEVIERLNAESKVLGSRIQSTLSRKFGSVFDQVSNSVFWDYNSADNQIACRAVVRSSFSVVSPRTITFYCYGGDRALPIFRIRY